ncbi:uncharacterized mitochondrial protein AtMg00810-like [Gastrolobium bilobum]|uniref:uncharacterized mitochondrial protein AtMg00810-like n=1 Tax=Gastrolobium bilobum TaxID=150636 RepID=UPI002AAF9136|nr:uncharacterized mitochondrial protein AtMg00810-like [Gastrolobium bilobum]
MASVKLPGSVNVDDIIVASNNHHEVQLLTATLHSTFKLKNLGSLKYFFARSTKGISVCQRHYALEILKDSGQLGCKPHSTSMDIGLKLSIADGDLLPDPSLYQRLIGRLLYLTITRPDLFFVVNHWAACPETRRSISDFCIFIGDSLISWKSKKQHTVSRSSTKVEYRSMANVRCDLLWLFSLLKDLHVLHPAPAHLFCDNHSTLHIAANSVFYERTKHIEIECHLVRKHILKGRLQTFPIPSSKQLADLLTKPMLLSKFDVLVSKMGVLNIHSPS